MEIRKIYEKESELYGKEIEIKGWIRKHRKQKDIGFIELSDGTYTNTSVAIKRLTNEQFNEFIYVYYNKGFKDNDSIEYVLQWLISLVTSNDNDIINTSFIDEDSPYDINQDGILTEKEFHDGWIDDIINDRWDR